MTQQVAMERDEAREYLESLVDKVLRVHTSDSRVFVGLFKCTDNVGKPATFLRFDIGACG